jgi:hypothetical protein
MHGNHSAEVSHNHSGTPLAWLRSSKLGKSSPSKFNFRRRQQTLKIHPTKPLHSWPPPPPIDILRSISILFFASYLLAIGPELRKLV